MQTREKCSLSDFSVERPRNCTTTACPGNENSSAVTGTDFSWMPAPLHWRRNAEECDVGDRACLSVGNWENKLEVEAQLNDLEKKQEGGKSVENTRVRYQREQNAESGEKIWCKRGAKKTKICKSTILARTVITS